MDNTLNNVVSKLDVCQFIDKVVKGELFGHPINGDEFSLTVDDCSVGVPVKVLSFPTKMEGMKVVLFFHGAIDQEKRQIPIFYGDQTAKRHFSNTFVLSISDPSLRLDKKIFSAFYAGDYEVPTHRIIAVLSRALRMVFPVNRFVFVGASSGAHPALYHSFGIEDSVCLVCNPILIMRSYWEKMVDVYVEKAWPSKSKHEVFGEIVHDDLVGLYANPSRNTVVITQNATDPYLVSMTGKLISSFPSNKNLLFISEYFSAQIGHSYPSNRFWDSVTAVVNALTNGVGDIATLLCPQADCKFQKPNDAASIHDLKIAKLLASQP